jgi:hypothetical protein
VQVRPGGAQTIPFAGKRFELRPREPFVCLHELLTAALSAAMLCTEAQDLRELAHSFLDANSPAGWCFRRRRMLKKVLAKLSSIFWRPLSP